MCVGRDNGGGFCGFCTLGGSDPDTSGGSDPDTSGGSDPDTSGGSDPDTSGGSDPDTSGGSEPDTSGLGGRPSGCAPDPAGQGCPADGWDGRRRLAAAP